ncbi:MAG: GNAT family N-acetyltransferase [Armatimonadetes bacterium]|nr:GNAT family N-acetyltransferase [Armatimonadota bacterium]
MLETTRLILREMTPADLDFMAEMLAHPEVMRYYPKLHTRDEARDWIERQMRRYREDGYGPWLVMSKATGEPIGQVGLAEQEVDGARETEVGYILHRPLWGRGYATEAAKACLDYAEEIGKTRIVALIRPVNEPSMRVAARLGMVFEKLSDFKGLPHNVMVAALPRVGCA